MTINCDVTYDNNHLKCLAAFGKKISDVQIFKLQKAKIKNIVLMLDPDALKRVGQPVLPAGELSHQVSRHHPAGPCADLV